MRSIVIAVVMGLAMTGCSGSETGEGQQKATGDDRVFPGGQKLRHYKQLDSYEWRVRIVENKGELLPLLQEVNPALEPQDLSDVVSTCDAIARGTNEAVLVQQTMMRFSEGSQGGVTKLEARRLINLAKKFACPA